MLIETTHAIDPSAEPPRVAVERTRLIPAMALSFLCRCPHCGEGKLFGRFLKTRPHCEACGMKLDGHRADDFPPYIVIFVVGHIVGYLILTFEMGYDVPLWVSVTLWPGLTLGLVALLLQPVKGAVIGLQYATRMHGFQVSPPPRPGAEETRVGPGDPAPAADIGRV
ncbi:DUF983 domain-containing protein [Methylobacterium gnaphalii]|uniref:DUF983 domain-containing protein n=1 Tax=Methylobacterium gnaphalii TaxID=1010610 RepID=A0A512JK88_9HYPH|nr:DUF983 domain-containing protein [Methylobacterium gnaphalii]GEP10376.1 hypothetical protein MGN01_22210 [Methylobacterium gnaphalii]GJD69165.1 hypothetical protein MMMDOFMJ_2091 [Methylobacterium gnaphalii]GLS47714.1 hypothetical protein GCM10007885_05580 [Methylobacterium gnaphalii]